MSKVIGICNLHNEPNIGELTNSRPLAVVSFLGRYGIIDFALSNFTNSHIDKIYVLVRRGIVGLRRHIGSDSIWTRNTKLGHVELLLNEKGLSNQPFNTDINNIKNGLDIDNLDFDYAVIAPTHMLSSMDYRPIIEAHEKSGAQVTAVYKHTSEASKEYLGCDKYKFNADGIITSVKRNIGRTDEADISLSTFIINKRILRKILNDSSKISQLYTIQDMLNFYIDEDTIKVHGYEFSGMVVPILTLEDYVNKSLGLLNYHVRNQLFLPDWPIYTSTHNTPPALYGPEAKVANSFVANGSNIQGTVINSVISRDVVIEKGAVVKNCILFSGTRVGKDTQLEYVVSDKNVKIKEVKDVRGEEDHYTYISFGANI